MNKQIKDRRRALVLSGGGAKGAFELGAMEFISSQKPEFFNFNIIAGVSVGSLNGAMVAQNHFPQLQKLWDEISNDKVYTGKMNLWCALWRIITNRKSVLGIKPLIKQIHDNINIAEVNTDYRMGFVSLISGEYVSCKHTDFGTDNDNFRKAILASCTMPIIWEPVDKVFAKQNLYQDLVDGGVRNVSPLGDLIDDNPDEIIIINCSHDKIEQQFDAGKNIFEIAKRSLTDITVNEIFRSDIDEFVRINNIVEQCKANSLTVYKDTEHKNKYEYFNAIIIEPDKDLGDSLDFSKEMIEMRRKAGWEAANAAFNKYQNSGHLTVRSFKS